MKLQCQPFTSSFILNGLLGQFINIGIIYQPYKPTIHTAIQLPQTEPVLNKLSPSDSSWLKRSLLHFLGDALQWLTGTAIKRDMTEIKWQINLLKQEQKKQQETLVHVIFILNVTPYATQLNRQKLNEVMDALQKVNKDVNILFNITDVLTQHLRYHQIYVYSHTILAYLRDCLMYVRQVTIHTMDYINAAMTNVMSSGILPAEELRSIFRHSKFQLPSIMHLSISSDNTLHF